jgi:DNA helicase-2/ATP-dependent DNA helicase PcrA
MPINPFTASLEPDQLLRELSERADVKAVKLPFNYRSAPEIVAAGLAALGEERGYSAQKTDKGLVAFHYFENGLEEQVSAIIGDLIPAVLERNETLSLGDVAIIYTDYNDGNLVSGAATTLGIEFVRIDRGAPIPTTPMIRWLQDCAEWCAGGWVRSQPQLRELTSAWQRMNSSIRRGLDLRDKRRALVRFLVTHRDPDESLRAWLQDLERDILRPTFAREGTLRDEQANVAILLKLTEQGNDLANPTIATFSGKAGSPNHLNLITLHSAKGLEYEVVFLLRMDEGRLPSWADKTPEKIAEARRRFYVGLTRAKREVHLTYSGFNENKYGRRFFSGPSRFLLEIRRRIES